MPKISVIIPVYNTEKYLSECLDSILSQTFKDIEVICVNDGSSDRSGDVLAEYAAKDDRIKVVTQDNKGPAAARNKGLDMAMGEWICFVDSDDAIPPEALLVLYTIAQESGCKVVASRNRLSTMQYKAIKEDNIPFEPTFVYRKWNGFKDFVQDSAIFSSSCNKLYNASLFQTQRFKEGILFEDWPMVTILFGRVDQYAITTFPCYMYREDNPSITRSVFSAQKVEGYVQGIRSVFEAYCNSNQLNDARKRMAVAVKMLVNKVYRSKNAELVAALLKQVQALFDEQIIFKKDLPLKTRWRLWRLKHQ